MFLFARRKRGPFAQGKNREDRPEGFLRQEKYRRGIPPPRPFRKPLLSKRLFCSLIFPSLVGKCRKIPIKYGSFIRTTKICLFSDPVIFFVSRRGTTKSCQKILRNYESNGPLLDTIKSPFSPCAQAYFLNFIVTFLHALDTII